MKQKLASIFILLLLLSACSSTAAPSATATHLAEATVTPAPTDTPDPTPEPPLPPSDVRVPQGENGELLISEKDLAPFDKRLMINPELEAEFAEKVFTICNQYTFLSEMAYEIQSRRNSSPLPDAIYQSFEDYKKLKIQPAIDNAETIKAFHLIGHETVANKQPGIGMVELLGEVDPSKCNVIFGKPSDVRPNSIKIDVGSYLIGMNSVEIDGKNIRQLIISPKFSDKNQYELFFANEKTDQNQNSTTYSQVLEVVSNDIDWLANYIPKSKDAQYKAQFVLGNTGSNGEQGRAKVMLAHPDGAGVELVNEWMKATPEYLLPYRP